MTHTGLVVERLLSRARLFARDVRGASTGRGTGGAAGRPPGARLSHAAAVAVALLLASAVAARADAYAVFVPLVRDQTPTPVVTVTPLHGACATAGTSVRFRATNDMPLEGEVAECYRLATLVAEDDSVIRANAVFIVVLLDIRNRGSLVAQVGLTNSIRLQAGGKPYALEPLDTQQAAAYVFGRTTVYSPISAGATVRQVFVFDVPWAAGGIGVVSEYPW